MFIYDLFSILCHLRCYFHLKGCLGPTYHLLFCWDTSSYITLRKTLKFIITHTVHKLGKDPFDSYSKIRDLFYLVVFQAHSLSQGSTEQYSDAASLLRAQKTESAYNWGFTLGVMAVESGPSVSHSEILLQNLTQYNSKVTYNMLYIFLFITFSMLFSLVTGVRELISRIIRQCTTYLWLISIIIKEVFWIVYSDWSEIIAQQLWL